jgi:hypothetical protein
MNKYNYLSFILILISFIFSLYDTFIYPRELSYDDYFPKTKDKSIKNKLIWYLSQITYQKQLLLLIYFILKIYQNNSSEFLLKIIAAPTIVINIFYFKYIFPHFKKNCENQNYKLYELKFIDLFPHFIDTVIILFEFMTLKNYKYSDIYLPLIFEFFMLFSICLNYKLRNVLSYRFLNLKKKRCYKLMLEFLIYTHIISLIFYKIKSN